MSVSKRIWIQTAVATAAILINLLAPQFAENTRYLLLALVILFIGMPHGALDHHIDGNLEGWNPYSLNKWFYGWYLSAIAVYSVIWIIFPFFSFMFFLLITLYHFGQADAERFRLTGWSKWVIHLSRGITVVGLIVFGDLEYSSSVIEAVTDISIYQIISEQYNPAQLMWLVASVYPVCYVLITVLKSTEIDHKLTYLVDALIVPLLFIYCDLVWAFAIYFGLWHSFNHALVMLNYLRSKEHEVTFGWFFKESFLFSLLSYLGLLFVYNMLNAFGNEELLVSLLFVVIAVLTLPHMLVVEKLYTRWNR
jgi:Brp/Blh family beta-carotene 15,15'-monooxygenase